jgi:hypothetical protein
MKRYCSGSLIPDSPLSGRLPLEGDCLDEDRRIKLNHRCQMCIHTAV